MVIDMELQEAKDAVFELMKKKDEIESNLRALKEILDNNHVGMSESLVDSSLKCCKIPPFHTFHIFV
ncbi:hypothetical protein EAI_13091 [Harpegnathos saltator]|uniref:Nas2 N-terminal domain-containing protein n=1 Tax=Harpegnathos saltator TaxID=610380 RepID=E2BVI0_HARSA|nr:hypothetical protein EAI_13091 [Harpegnathos saltator]